MPSCLMDGLPDRGVDALHPLDQRRMGAGQGAGGQFRLEQGADRGQFLDPFAGQLRGGHPARVRQKQRPFGHQTPHRLARGRHRDVVIAADPAQGQRLTRRDLAMQDLAAQRTIDAVMGGRSGIGGRLQRRRRCRQHGCIMAQLRARRQSASSTIPDHASAAIADGAVSPGRAGCRAPRTGPNGSSRPDARPHARRRNRGSRAAP